MQDVKLETLAGGAIAERFNDALQEVLDNIVDPNTDYKKARKVTLSVSFKPREDRSFAIVGCDVKTTIAPPKVVETGIVIDTDGRGRAVAAEYANQIPGQMDVEEVQNSKVVSMK